MHLAPIERSGDGAVSLRRRCRSRSWRPQAAARTSACNLTCVHLAGCGPDCLTGPPTSHMGTWPLRSVAIGSLAIWPRGCLAGCIPAWLASHTSMHIWIPAELRQPVEPSVEADCDSTCLFAGRFQQRHKCATSELQPLENISRQIGEIKHLTQT